MTFAKAGFKDLKGVVKLLKHLFKQEAEFSFNKKLQTKAVARVLKDKNAAIYAMKKGKKVIASATLFFNTGTALGAKVATLEDVIVDPGCRGQGIGSRLLKKVLKEMDRKKVKRVSLLTDDDNYRARKFYKKLGFKESKMKLLRRQDG